MLATINESLFPIFLFLLYFCVISVTLTRRSNASGASESMKDTPSAPDSEIEITAPPIDREIVPVPDGDSRQFEREDDSLVQTEILIDKLTKRSCRKICKPLGIRQTRGKTEKPLTSIKAEIQELFRENPARVRSVIEVNLPELLLALDRESGIA
ncbi:hypothetical protein V0288_12025 [Pannus brasiliensis CCIBt3594]|uniref:Uncharacterized protein n=1 Tax=Pannus brasiliensis CCIBt3594 TaxID=1427578 RepID=A0AAW9QRJ7_9CHRO